MRRPVSRILLNPYRRWPGLCYRLFPIIADKDRQLPNRNRRRALRRLGLPPPLPYLTHLPFLYPQPLLALRLELHHRPLPHPGARARRLPHAALPPPNPTPPPPKNPVPLRDLRRPPLLRQPIQRLLPRPDHVPRPATLLQIHPTPDLRLRQRPLRLHGR